MQVPALSNTMYSTVWGMCPWSYLLHPEVTTVYVCDLSRRRFSRRPRIWRRQFLSYRGVYRKVVLRWRRKTSRWRCKPRERRN